MDNIVTVVVPFYKTPKIKFRKCIESIQNQYYKNLEIILVDDGNTDDYKQLVHEYSSKDSRIKYIYQENTGVSAARNRAIDSAEGDYICFIDSDDYIEKNFVDELVTNIQGSELVGCSVLEQDFLVQNIYVDMKYFASMPSKFREIQYINFCANKLFKLDIIKKYNLRFRTDIKLGEDALFLNHYFEHCNHIRFINKGLYHYVPHQNSAVKSYKPDYWKWEKEVIQRQYAFFTKYPLNKQEKSALGKWLFLKIKGCIYYYLDNEKDKFKLNNILNEIQTDELYIQANRNLNINGLDRNNRIIFYLIKLFSITGMKIIKQIRMHK